MGVHFLACPTLALCALIKMVYRARDGLRDCDLFYFWCTLCVMDEVTVRKKIRFEENPTEWDHHRGGWTFAFQCLRQKLTARDGVLCISAVEEWVMEGKVITQPWIGFVHQVPRNNYPNYPDLEHLVRDDVFLRSLDKCLGLFVLSQVVKDYLLHHLSLSVAIARVLYPISPFPDECMFDWEKFSACKSKRVLFVGEFLRNFQAFFDLPVPKGYQKCLLKPPDVNFQRLFDCEKRRFVLKMNDSVVVKDRVTDEEYDELLSSSIVFLNLYDAPANTTVVECLGRNTPLVINRLPGVEEYLGSSYPLFYDTIEEAATLLENVSLQQEAVRYMQSLPIKLQLSAEKFILNFVSSSIYRALPLPLSQKHDSTQTKFPQFDVTVVICSYKRVYNLKNLLDCFKNQDFTGSFEIILWNNNSETQDEVKGICSEYMDALNMRLIQSSENYYCIIRLAVSRLMRSEVMLICDDDVIPKPQYISLFLSKFKEYGPNTVICCRGHIFDQHNLDEEKPQNFWEYYEHLKFFDETTPDREVR